MRHVTMHCENHPEMIYTCKSIAVNNNGRYSAERNIFAVSEAAKYRECTCPGSALIVSDFEDLKAARLEE